MNRNDWHALKDAIQADLATHRRRGDQGLGKNAGYLTYPMVIYNTHVHAASILYLLAGCGIVSTRVTRIARV